MGAGPGGHHPTVGIHQDRSVRTSSKNGVTDSYRIAAVLKRQIREALEELALGAAVCRERYLGKKGVKESQDKRIAAAVHVVNLRRKSADRIPFCLNQRTNRNRIDDFVNLLMESERFAH
jgi:hypothetical protein